MFAKQDIFIIFSPPSSFSHNLVIFRTLYFVQEARTCELVFLSNSLIPSSCFLPGHVSGLHRAIARLTALPITIKTHIKRIVHTVQTKLDHSQHTEENESLLI
uniref:Uncharacterized protein n=1 Tax=Cacopsylla melanoneura TaxID=428564 RepID=A0A8D9EXK7_9HEMI